MKNCQKCGKEFPSTLVIDGKRRVVANRKYCLDCSPFGSKNTRKLHEDRAVDPVNDIYLCQQCGRTYKRTKSQRSRKMCLSCMVIQIRQRRKQRAVEYKGGKCQFCGYSKCMRAMEFHHPDPSKKDITISGKSLKWETIRAELDKCFLVCANCHREIHAGMLVPG